MNFFSYDRYNDMETRLEHSISQRGDCIQTMECLSVELIIYIYIYNTYPMDAYINLRHSF